MRRHDGMDFGEARPRLDQEERKLELEQELGGPALRRIDPRGAGVAGDRDEGACDPRAVCTALRGAGQERAEAALRRVEAPFEVGEKAALEVADAAGAGLERRAPSPPALAEPPDRGRGVAGRICAV